jgi:O-antigen/teichoic acid export membrane protein
LLPLLTAVLDPAEYGVVSVLLAFGLFLTTVFSLGFGASVMPSYFEGATQRQRDATIWTAFVILGVSSAVMVAFAIHFSEDIARWILLAPSYGPLVVLTAESTAFNCLSTPFRQYLIFVNRPVAHVWLSLASLTVTVCLTIWFVVILDEGIAGVLKAELAGHVVTCLLFAVPVWRSSRIHFEPALARHLLKLGLPLIPAFGAVFVLQHGGRYILQWLHGSAQVGLYVAGSNIGSVIGLLVSGFQSAWTPFFMSFINRSEESGPHLARACTYYVFGVGGASLLLYIVAKPVVMVVTPEAYHGASVAVGLAATAQFLSGLFLILVPQLYFAREVQYLAVVQVTAAALSLGLNLLLAHSFGYIGSAIALVLGFVALIVLQFSWNLIRRYPTVHYDWPRLARFGTVYLLIALSSLIPRHLTLKWEAALSIGWTTLLVWSIWAMTSLEERQRLREWCNRTRAAVNWAAKI